MFVFGDPTQLHQVLMDLCTNAIQAMGERGMLRVHLDPADLRAERGFRTASCSRDRTRGSKSRTPGRASTRRSSRAFSSVLHHQEYRQGNRARPVAGLWHRHRFRRRHRRDERSRKGHDIHHLAGSVDTAAEA